MVDELIAEHKKLQAELIKANQMLAILDATVANDITIEGVLELFVNSDHLTVEPTVVWTAEDIGAASCITDLAKMLIAREENDRTGTD